MYGPKEWAPIEEQIAQSQATAMADITAAQRGGNEVHLGKTESDMMVNPVGISCATSVSS